MLETRSATAPSRVLVFAARFECVHRHCAGLLDRGFEVHFVAEVAALLELALDQRFRVVVASLPIPRSALDRLLARPRESAGQSPRASVVLLAYRSQLARAQDLLARGASRVFAETTSPQSLAESVVDLLRRAPRAHLNVPARLELRQPRGPEVTWGETVNLSTSGLLLRTPALYPLGSTFHVQLQVEGLPDPIAGMACLARQARTDLEGFEGFAAHFRRFEGNGEARLEALVRSRLQ